MDINRFNLYFSDIVRYTIPPDYLQEQPAAGEGEAVPPEGDSRGQALPPQGAGAGMPQGGQMPPGEEGMLPEDQMGMGGEEIEISIGRIFEMKKIYSKLLAIDKLLDHYSDIRLDDLKQKIMEALDLFHIISLNLDKFEQKIDGIIVDFYSFIKESIEEFSSIVVVIKREADTGIDDKEKPKKKRKRRA